MDEKTVKKILGIIIKADEQDWEWERMGKELDAALYSEPQVDKAYLNFEPPEKPQVCPECSGFGSITIAGCSGTKNIKCPKCNGTGNVPAQPQQPVPTEELLTDEEILDLGKKYCYQSTRPAIATWELCWMKEICQSQLLKCQQSESAEIAELKSQLESCVNTLKERDNMLEKAEARIKELEIQTQSCGDCDKDIRADERRKVRQDLKDYICEECSTPNFIHVVIPLKIWEEWQK